MAAYHPPVGKSGRTSAILRALFIKEFPDVTRRALRRIGPRHCPYSDSLHPV